MERLRHRPERRGEAGRLRAGDPERVRHLNGAQPEQLARGGGRSEVPEGGRGVPAPLGEFGTDHAAQACLDLEARDEGGERVGAREVTPLAQRQHDGGDGRRAVHDGREVGVVEVERVGLGAIRHRGQQRARARAPSDHGGLRVPARGGDHGRERIGERLGGAANRHAEPVGHGADRRLDDGRWQGGELETEHEVHQGVQHRRGSIAHRVVSCGPGRAEGVALACGLPASPRAVARIIPTRRRHSRPEIAPRALGWRLRGAHGRDSQHGLLAWREGRRTCKPGYSPLSSFLNTRRAFGCP
jgi:hypothetical protein